MAEREPGLGYQDQKLTPEKKAYLSRRAQETLREDLDHEFPPEPTEEEEVEIRTAVREFMHPKVH